MSLELPRPPIPLTAKDSEFLQRRPDLFYPYLQTPFNGKSHHPHPIGMENGLLRAAPPESLLDTNGTFETNGKDNNNLPTSLRIPFPHTYGRGMLFGGQPLPPSLRPNFPSDYSNTLASHRTPQSHSSEKEKILTRNSSSPETSHIRPSKSLSNPNMDIELLDHNSDENDDVSIDKRNEEINDNSFPHVSSPMTSKDSVDDVHKYNSSDESQQEKGKEANEVPTLQPKHSENGSKMSSESILT